MSTIRLTTPRSLLSCPPNGSGSSLVAPVNEFRDCWVMDTLPLLVSISSVPGYHPLGNYRAGVISLQISMFNYFIGPRRNTSNGLRVLIIESFFSIANRLSNLLHFRTFPLFYLSNYLFLSFFSISLFLSVTLSFSLSQNIPPSCTFRFDFKRRLFERSSPEQVVTFYPAANSTPYFPPSRFLDSPSPRYTEDDRKMRATKRERS